MADHPASADPSTIPNTAPQQTPLVEAVAATSTQPDVPVQKKEENKEEPPQPAEGQDAEAEEPENYRKIEGLDMSLDELAKLHRNPVQRRRGRGGRGSAPPRRTPYASMRLRYCLVYSSRTTRGTVL